MLPKNLIVLSFLLLACTQLLAQSTDTVYTSYPGSDQRWDKIYENSALVAENILYEDESPWMTVRYSPDEAEHWKWFHDNGEPYFEAAIVNDLLQGSYRIWYENGQLAEHLYFVDNVENGPAVFYHPNGKVAMQGTYRNGQMIGEWRFFDESGKPANGSWSWPFAASPAYPRVVGQLENGQPTGRWRYKGVANMGRSSQLSFQRQYD